MMMVVVAVVVVVLVSGALAVPDTTVPPVRAQAPAAQDQPAPVSTRPPLQVTPAAGLPSDAGTRDASRLSDLQAIAAALQSYHDKKNAYPDTSNRVQTACVFQNLDKLCEIKNEVGLERLVDQRGGNAFGYWYSSDGKTFTVYASLEGAPDGSDPCPQTASVIKAPNLFCLNSHQ